MPSGRRASRTRAFRTPTIAVINRSTLDLGVDFDALVPALQRFVEDCFAPVWNTPCKLIKSKAQRAGAWALVLLDKADPADKDDEGYHFTKQGLPLGRVFIKDTLKQDDKVSVTACHELAEMLVDPGINLWSDGRGVEQYAYEVCDAVEEIEFKIDGIAMSDFVYPAWFEGFHKRGSVRFDYTGDCTRPFQILKGGYAQLRHGKRTWNIYGSKAKRKKFRREDRAGHRSEFRKLEVDRVG